MSDEFLLVDGSYSLGDAILHIAALPPRQPPYALYVTENFLLATFDKRPNRWHRFWQRLLLGWRWEETP